VYIDDDFVNDEIGGECKKNGGRKNIKENMTISSHE